VTTDSVELEAPRFETGPSLVIAGLRGHFTLATADGIPAQWQRFVSLGPVPGMIGPVEYGLCFPMASGFDYMCGVEVSGVASLPSEISHTTIPARRYAVFAHRQHVSKLRNTLDDVWHKWFPSSGYKPVQPAPDAPAFFERYGERFNPQTGMGDVEVWMPIQ
jgi:AraC family transcriptional regulator